MSISRAVARALMAAVALTIAAGGVGCGDSDDGGAARDGATTTPAVDGGSRADRTALRTDTDREKPAKSRDGSTRSGGGDAGGGAGGADGGGGSAGGGDGAADSGNRASDEGSRAGTRLGSGETAGEAAEEERVATVVRELYGAFGSADAGGVCSRVTNAVRAQMARQVLGPSDVPPGQRTCTQSFARFLGAALKSGMLDRVRNMRVVAVEVDGPTARATVTLGGRQGAVRLVKEEGEWRFGEPPRG